MKMTMAVAALVMATLTVNAQQAGGKSGGFNGGGQGGGAQGGQQGGQQHQRPSPEQMTEQLMTKFDANKDGKLDVGELTQALEALRAHRPPQGGAQHRGPGGQGGAQQGGKSELGGGTQGGQQHHGPAGGGADQDGAKAQRPTPPPAGEVAAKMIEKFAADKKGLTQAEFATALADRHTHRGPHGGPGGQQHGQGGNAQGAAGAAK